MAKKKKHAELLNELTYFLTFQRLKNIAINIFKWEGLPEGIKERHIEIPLFEYGRVLFFEDSSYGLMALPAHSDSGRNVYNEPIKYRAFGHNYNKEYTVDESIVIRNNPLEQPTKDYIHLYSEKLTEIERTMDVNVKSLKTPYIIACDDKDLLTLKNIYRQIDGNIPAIFADKSLNLDSLEVLETKSELLVDRLADYRNDVTNEVLTFLGINNANTDKRERLITDEVKANEEYIEVNAKLMLDERKDAAEKINEMFGLNLSVKMRDFSGGEVEQDGELHNGIEDSD